jgi:hypothetical protein
LSETKKGKTKISFEISKELEGGVYANQAFIIHSRKEFIIDFGLTLPTRNIRVQSRIITNPIDAKAIYLALEENIKNYEKKFGPIPVPQQIPKDTPIH